MTTPDGDETNSARPSDEVISPEEAAWARRYARSGTARRVATPSLDGSRLARLAANERIGIHLEDLYEMVLPAASQGDGRAVDRALKILRQQTVLQGLDNPRPRAVQLLSDEQVQELIADDLKKIDALEAPLGDES